MSPEHWSEVQRLFHEVADLPPAAQAARLQGHAPALRADVERLLAAEAAPPSWLQGLTQTLSDASTVSLEDGPPAPGSEAPRRIGPYRLLGELGRGGMGTVYLAERADIDKRVALKLVRAAAPETVRRFLLERRVLARLEHAHIAHLLDAGFATVGTEQVPYFAMEYVDGVPLTTYADRHRLGVRERLRLFLDVCDAVQYAHQRLVVHRDLKPSNILVTEDDAGGAQVKLLDFGIAKLLEDDDTVEGLTRTGARIMTPEYAAPEQVRADAVTTVSDVYALGVVLYELLAGRRPYELRGRSAAEMERVVCEVMPPRPSDAVATQAEASGAEGGYGDGVTLTHGVDPERLRRRLAGDLDTVVMKALEKEPGRRYASVEVLAEDVRRHLRGQPILARPQTAVYRLRKFVRRHRAGVTATAAGLAAVVALTAFFMVQLAAERDHARLEAQKAEEVSRFLGDLFDAADPVAAEPVRVDTLSARALLARGAARARATLADQPELQADLFDRIGSLYKNLSLFEEADSLLTDALALSRSLYGDGDLRTAQVYGNLGSTYVRAGRYDEAEPLLRAALPVLRQHPAERDELSTVVAALGELERQRRHLAAAESLYQEVIELRQAFLAEAAPGTPEARTRAVHLSGAMNDLGNIYRDLDRPDAAETLYRQSLALKEDHLPPEHPERLTNLNNLAGALSAQGQYAAAEAIYRDLIAVQTEHFPDDAYSLSVWRNNLARALRDQERYAEAEAEQREAVRLGREALGDDHPALGAFLANLARIHTYQERDAAAIPLYAEAAAIQRAAYGTPHPTVSVTLTDLGRAHLRAGDPAAALAPLREVLAFGADRISGGVVGEAVVRYYLGSCLHTLDRRAEAAPLLHASYAVFEAELGADDAQAVRAAEALADLYDADGDAAQAAEWRARTQAES